MNAIHTIDYHARASAYRFIGLFLSLPDATVARGVSDGSAAADLGDILVECGIGAGRASEIAGLFSETGSEEGLLPQLRQDYTRLFTNPEKPLVPIYEAVFKKSDDFDTSQLVFISPTAMDADKSYRKFGLAVDPKRHDSPDHMGAEMDFVCYLYFSLADAVAQEDAETVREIEGALRAFYEKHTSKWAERFFNEVSERASTAQYRAIGAAGCALFDQERGMWAVS